MYPPGEALRHKKVCLGLSLGSGWAARLSQIETLPGKPQEAQTPNLD